MRVGNEMTVDHFPVYFYAIFFAVVNFENDSGPGCLQQLDELGSDTFNERVLDAAEEL